LQQKMPDPDMKGVVEATDWFCFNDCLQTKINTLQNYSVYPYLDFAFVIWHYLFATMAYPKIQFPHKGFEVEIAVFCYLYTLTLNLIPRPRRK
jgi:chromosome transmission fidelity protein 18